MTADESRTEAGFKERTRVDAARAALAERVAPVERTERVSLPAADGRALAEPIVADRPVPHYRRAAMDGWAVRAADTFGASGRSPAILRPAETVGPDRAVRVHTGSELPDGADAVVVVEDVDRVGDELEVFDAVGGGENVAPVGEDVEDGQPLYEPGHRLRPSDLGLLRAVGVDEVAVAARPTVAVCPTGEELVADNPGPGEVVETNGLTVSRLVERWGGTATYGDVVTDDRAALREAIRDAVADHDVVVTTGGTGVSGRDETRETLGETDVRVRDVPVRPGSNSTVAWLDEPAAVVVSLPGPPGAAFASATLLARPLFVGASRTPTVTGTMTCDLPVPDRDLTFVVPVELRGGGAGDGGEAGDTGGDSGEAGDTGSDSTADPQVVPFGHPSSTVELYPDRFRPHRVATCARLSAADGFVLAGSDLDEGQRVAVRPCEVVES